LEYVPIQWLCTKASSQERNLPHMESAELAIFGLDSHCCRKEREGRACRSGSTTGYVALLESFLASSQSLEHRERKCASVRSRWHRGETHSRRTIGKHSHSVMIRSAHSTSETKIAGLPNFASQSFRSVSATPRAREQAPQAKTGMRLATILSRNSLRGGQPTAKIAVAVALRIKYVASPVRKIRTSCPASARASPCTKGKDARVGSSEPQALLIMIFSDLCGAPSCAFAAPNPSRPNPNICGILERSCRLIIMPPGRISVRAEDEMYHGSISNSSSSE
jgi:hypothetical protein